MRRTKDRRQIANLSMATSETWRDKDTGERKEKTEWHRVVIFYEPLCKVVEQYLKKGTKVYIEGALQTRKWTTRAASRSTRPKSCFRASTPRSPCSTAAAAAVAAQLRLR